MCHFFQPPTGQHVTEEVESFNKSYLMHFNQVQKCLLYLTQIFIDFRETKASKEKYLSLPDVLYITGHSISPSYPCVKPHNSCLTESCLSGRHQSWSRYIGRKETHHSFCNFFHWLIPHTFTFFLNFSFEFVWFLFPAIVSCNSFVC